MVLDVFWRLDVRGGEGLGLSGVWEGSGRSGSGGFGRVLDVGVICNILFPVFSQSYFPALFFFGILSRPSSFSFFFKYCLSVFHSVASSRQLDDFTLVQQPVK